MREIAVGHSHTLHFCVPVTKTVPYLYPEAEPFRAMPEVFATGFLVGFLEWACMEALAPFLEEGEQSVGTLVDITHEAATPPGMTVTAQVRLDEVDGRRTRWSVEARDAADVIARGYHERFTIDHDKFVARLAKKAADASV
ncbi:Fluoroacetyl-CoA thioesterase [Desulfuromonas sp. DDH964]|uniref:thioesterase family protein n=1 Tax=Desulfuromonas sp. DDH964 TaxID=1823759 RepID=UPI00078D72AC|nr:thioesterase family protein [Desulfuromonas sp. DDH964]AMV71770.1 Fluoroacetyl-CoA thioesterase [Desulfuromonas sp. DDH964]